MKTLIMAVVILTSSGCATIFSGTTQQVYIDSNPPGAFVTIGNMRVKTPAVVTLGRNSEGYTLVAKLEGYKSQTKNIGVKYNHWMDLNLIWAYDGGRAISIGNPVALAIDVTILLISSIVDFSTGAAFYLDTDKVFFELEVDPDWDDPSDGLG